MSEVEFDAVIVGAGIVGAMVAKELTRAGKRVLILEAGTASGVDNDDYQSFKTYSSYVDRFQTAVLKIPNSPYPKNPNAPSTYATDNVQIPTDGATANGYAVQDGAYPFMSSYLRQQGGTTLHWMASCPRLLPDDFRMNSHFGVGNDWPIQYDDLIDDYAKAEWQIGVSANVEEQHFAGKVYPDHYNFPMQGLPASYSDNWIGNHINGKTITIDGIDYHPEVVGLPLARNSTPRMFPQTVQDEGNPWYDPELVNEVDGTISYKPRGAVGAPHVGLRCEGNSSCTPICPVQAKYTALKTLSELNNGLCEIRNQCVVSTLDCDEQGRISQVNYIEYGNGKSTVRCVTAGVYVLAAHAIENAKILLASNVANSSDQVGRNLMDHPYFMTWGLAPENIGSFRGPGYTSGIPAFRNGDFRRDWAAFRIDLGNWGWNFSAFSPGSDVGRLVGSGVTGKALRHALADEVPRQLRFGFQIEQLPSSSNRVTISDQFRDASGLHRPIITYDVADYTWDSMLKGIEISNHLFDALKVKPDERFHLGGGDGDANKLPTYCEYKGTKLGFYGAGHIMGTHCMGNSKSDSVVNDKQQSWDHDNLYITGCGSFPTVGTANPTLTAVALAFRSSRDMLRVLG